MVIRFTVVILALLLGFSVSAQNNAYDPAPNTPDDNWCFEGGPWGDGRCNDSDPFITLFNWSIGWYMPRCEAHIFPEDNLPPPCIIPEIESESDNSASPITVISGGGGVSSDSDGDGLPDAWEISLLGDISQGATDDTDGDGCNNLCEFQRGTSPSFLDVLACNVDVANNTRNLTLGSDGIPDGFDTDCDGLNDGQELPNSSPTNPDTDGDGFFDGHEVASGSNPRDPTSTP